jgi:hypothetical protein
MSIDKLLRVLPVPKHRPTVGDWSRVPFELPDDYKDFIARYGAGNLADYVHIWSPFAAGTSDLVAQATQYSNDLRSIRSKHHRYKFYPDKGGLLTWGRTDNGDSLTWSTTGPPSKWRVVVTDGIDATPTAKTFTEFLTGIVSATFKAPGVAQDAHGKATFYPTAAASRTAPRAPRRSRMRARDTRSRKGPRGQS